MANFSPYPLQLQQQHVFPPAPPLRQQQNYYVSNPNPNPNPNPNEGPSPSSAGPTPAAASAAAATTLLVRHLPEAIPHEMLSRLFSHYGASSVRPCAGGKLRNCAFVDFKDEALASQAQAQMNRYEYPLPDGNILTNIVNALIAVPRFYTQVLHLMNKMNLPAPFRMALPTPPLPPPVPAPPPPSPPVPVEPPRPDLSSDESELESSEDDAGDNQNRKRIKRESIVGPAIDKAVAHEAVGLKPVSLVPKEVPMIKKKNPVLQIKIASKPIQKEITYDGNSTKELTEPLQKLVEQRPYATPEEIEKGKLPPEDILSLPMFKNYAAGNPAMVLYIKNLAKDVVSDDFYFIFGSLFESVEAAKSGLNIKLMQEGRMRGQAFVTFPSIDLAHRALNLVNGYVFRGKPMIIQFGRSPAAGKTT